MGRSERADHFERLCDLRAGYGSRPDDRHGVFSVEDVLTYAQAVMVAVDETAGEDSTFVPERADRAVMVSDPDPHPESPTGTIDGGSARRSIGLVDFDWTDAERRIRRIDLPALEPRSDGLWMGDNDGWRHLGVFIDRFGPTAGDRLD